MKLVIFGATGATGQELVKQALNQNYKVTALVRNPDRLKDLSIKINIIKGDARDAKAVEKAVKGKTAVISALGTKPGVKPVCAEGIINILKAMKKHKVRRLIVESAYGASETRKHSLFTNLLARVLIRKIMKDKDRMEAIIRASDIDWTIVRPVILTNKPLAKKYKVGLDLKIKGFKKISRADVAYFMIGELKKNEFVRKAPVISNI